MAGRSVDLDSRRIHAEGFAENFRTSVAFDRYLSQLRNRRNMKTEDLDVLKSQFLRNVETLQVFSSNMSQHFDVCDSVVSDSLASSGVAQIGTEISKQYIGATSLRMLAPLRPGTKGPIMRSIKAKETKYPTLGPYKPGRNRLNLSSLSRFGISYGSGISRPAPSTPRAKRRAAVDTLRSLSLQRAVGDEQLATALSPALVRPPEARPALPLKVPSSFRALSPRPMDVGMFMSAEMMEKPMPLPPGRPSPRPPMRPGVSSLATHGAPAVPSRAPPPLPSMTVSPGFSVAYPGPPALPPPRPPVPAHGQSPALPAKDRSEPLQFAQASPPSFQGNV